MRIPFERNTSKRVGRRRCTSKIRRKARVNMNKTPKKRRIGEGIWANFLENNAIFQGWSWWKWRLVAMWCGTMGSKTWFWNQNSSPFVAVLSLLSHRGRNGGAQQPLDCVSRILLQRPTFPLALLFTLYPPRISNAFIGPLYFLIEIEMFRSVDVRI